MVLSKLKDSLKKEIELEKTNIKNIGIRGFLFMLGMMFMLVSTSTFILIFMEAFFSPAKAVIVDINSLMGEGNLEFVLICLFFIPFLFFLWVTGKKILIQLKRGIL